MKEKRVTKKAIFASLLSVAVCTSMLIGTSYAWFTDSVTSSGNVIKSGTLDIELKYADEADPAAAQWKDASEGAIFDYDLWEPGYVSVKQVKLANVGSLALKYQFNIIPSGTLAKTEDGQTLADVIDVYYYDPATAINERTDLGPADATNDHYLGTLSQALAGVANTAEGKLYPAGNEDGKDSEVTVTLALKMKEEAGNAFQDMSIGNSFAVQVIATQWTYEEDSFDNKYDELADTTPDITMATTKADFANALANAKDGDVIDAGGANVGKYVGQTVDAAVTIENAVIDGTEDSIYSMANTTFNKPVTFKNCTFESAGGGYQSGMYYNTFKGGAVFEDCTIHGGKSGFYNTYTHGDITFNRCTIAGDWCYAFNVNGGNGNTNTNVVTFNDCTVKGWVSFDRSGVSKVVVNNTSFVRDGATYACARFYQDAEFNNCVFDDDYYWLTEDGLLRAIDACADNITIELNNTAVDTAKLTTNGAKTGVKFIVDGTEVTPAGG